MSGGDDGEIDNFSVKQVAAYLQLNEKKVYALVGRDDAGDQRSPASGCSPRTDRPVDDGFRARLLATGWSSPVVMTPLLRARVGAFCAICTAMAQISLRPPGHVSARPAAGQSGRCQCAALGPLAEAGCVIRRCWRQHGSTAAG